MALTNKTVAGSYKDLLQVDNSNSGLTSSGKTIKDGDGNSSCLALGANRITVTPSANSTANVTMNNASGDVLLKVDGTNKLVNVNETQLAANTQYLRFGAKDIDVDNGTHIGVPIAGMGANAAVTFGTSANPGAPTMSNNGDDWLHYLHYVDTNITIDSVIILTGATTATGDTLGYHLIALGTGDTSVVDDMTSTTVVADQTAWANGGYEDMYKHQLTVQSADVDAGDYLALTIEGNGTNSDYSVNALVRYHLR